MSLKCPLMVDYVPKTNYSELRDDYRDKFMVQSITKQMREFPVWNHSTTFKVDILPNQS